MVPGDKERQKNKQKNDKSKYNLILKICINMSNMLLGHIKIFVKTCMLKLDRLCYLIFNKYINHWFLLEGNVGEPIVLNLRNKINYTILSK